MLQLLKCCRPLIPIPRCSLSRSQKLSHIHRHQILVNAQRLRLRRTTAQSFTCVPRAQTSINGDALEGKSSMELWVYNTMSKQKEVFRPKVPGKVGMYVCGVTAYDLSHIGHARVYVCFDVLYRYLRHLGYEVCYVRNFTDVDDKIIARANELGEDPINLSRRYSEEFLQDMEHLNCLSPSVEPRVSDHMPQIIDIIKQVVDLFKQSLLPRCFLFLMYPISHLNHCFRILMRNGQILNSVSSGSLIRILCKGSAYRVDGDVYFSVDKFPNYGCLSGRKLEHNRAGERVAIDTRKRNPADFALWKSAKEGEPSWSSPWGPGRPGWHIECSAMSAEYLGFQFDIHGGGMDLIFPHHENEIAQSCSACDDSNVRYWMHNGFVTIDSEKMSKSLGNFFTIRQVIGLYHPLALRLFLIGTHYRSPINYSDVQLEKASDRAFYIYQTLYDCEEVLRSKNNSEKTEDSIPQDIADCINRFEEEAWSSMCDDLLTPVVLSAMSEPLKFINDLLHTRKGKKQGSRIESLAALENVIKRTLNILGLNLGSYGQVLEQLRGKALKRAKITEDEVLRKIVERDSARKNKDFERSDSIRKELAAVGIALMDSPNGTIWRPTLPISLQEQPPVVAT